MIDAGRVRHTSVRQQGQRTLPRFVAVAMAALALSTGCGDSPTGNEFPSDTPYIAGRVTAVTTTSDRAVSVRVEAIPADQSGSPKLVARVDDFALVQLPGNVEADYRAVTVGQWVRVWTTGAVADSYPAQGIASAVAIDSLPTILLPARLR